MIETMKEYPYSTVGSAHHENLEFLLRNRICVPEIFLRALDPQIIPVGILTDKIRQ